MREAAPVQELTAPAKVNLGLRVVGRRPDGYHELESLFVPLDLADRLRLEAREAAETSLAIEVAAADGVPGAAPADASNLAVRAAAAFLERAGRHARVRLVLEKRIPSPGGLGGGSSDAAAVLRGLAARFPDALDAPALAELALSLGADVPFFLGPVGAGPVPARVAGIGERVAPAPEVPSLVLALVHPGARLETARVYAEFDAAAGRAGSLTGPGGAPTMPALSEPAGPTDPSEPGGPRSSGRWASPEWLSQLLVNDLEPAACRLCPAIAGVRDALAASGALAVGLSGSGPTVFGIFPDAPAASEALEGDALRHLAAGPEGPRGWRGVARTMASPGPD